MRTIDESQLASFKTLKVRHPRQDEIEQFLLGAIAGYRSYTLLDLYGASGVGKSTVVEQVARKVNHDETNPAVVPVVIVQASPEDVGSQARLDFYQQILDQLQRHPAIRDRTKNLQLYLNSAKKSSDPAEWLEMRNIVEYALALLQVKVVFVDEAQHLMATDSRSRPTAQLDWIKTLANRTNVLYVKYNLKVRRRLMTLTSDSCGRIEKAELFIASMHEELSHGRDSLGVLPAGGTT